MNANDPRRGPTLTDAEVQTFLGEGVLLFDAGRHWHAHEAWEHAWHRAPNEERDFFRGLIHAAAALVHHQRGNRTGWLLQTGRMHERLPAYAPCHRGIDVQGLLDALDALPEPGSPTTYPTLGPLREP